MSWLKPAIFIGFLGISSAFSLDLDGVKVANIEKHNGNYSNCSPSSQEYFWIRFKKTDGTLTGYYAVPTSSGAYKDLFSIALTALTSGTLVNARGQEVSTCFNAGILTALNLVGR